MGYPRRVALSRPAQAGFRAPSTARAPLSAEARQSARTPLKSFVDNAPAILEQAIDIGTLLPGVYGRYFRLLRYLMDAGKALNLLNNLLGRQFVIQGYGHCPQPACGNPSRLPSTHWQGFNATGCATIGGDCPAVLNTGQSALPVNPASSWNRINMYKQNGAQFWWNSQHYKVAGTAIGPIAWNQGAIEFRPPIEIPMIPSRLDPLQRPIHNPDIDWPQIPYRDLPYREPLPDRSPVEQPWRGPVPPPRVRPDEFPLWVRPGFVPPPRPDTRPGTRPDVRPDVRPPPRPDTRPDVRPDQKPKIDFDVNTDGRSGPRFLIDGEGRLNMRPQFRPRKPPEKNTKERKVRVTLGRFSIVVNAITETKDFVEALWKALPKNQRSKPEKGHRKVTLQAMLADLYRNWEDLDLSKGIVNVIENEIQDRFYGQAGQAFKGAAARLNAQGYYDRPVGFQFGDRYRPQVNQDTGEWAYQRAYKEFKESLPKFTAKDLYREFWP